MIHINKLLSDLMTVSFNDYLYRNIKMQISTKEKYSDLGEDEFDWETARKAELQSRKFDNDSPVEGPFNESIFFNSIVYPFQLQNWRSSRYSNGRYGVWYGALDINTTIYETVYHWKKEFLEVLISNKIQRYEQSERIIYKVNCNAALLDFRSKSKEFPDLIDPEDYTFCQLLGGHLFDQGNPGLLSNSARCHNGSISAIFTQKVLNNPINFCNLHYTLDTTNNTVKIENESGTILEY